MAEATATVRRAGRCELSNGAELLWSLAEGSRGRRWRAILRVEGRVEQSLLLEVLANGRPSRLELATTAGMLTLHPEPDEPSIHGNVVRPDGVRPLAFPWSPQHEFVVVDQPISALVTVHGLASRVTPGSSVTLPVLIVDGHLEVTERSRTFLREGPDRWRLNGLGDGPDEPVIVGESGLPGLDGCAAEWPIEAPAEG